jgi:hypothetical protein
MHAYEVFHTLASMPLAVLVTSTITYGVVMEMQGKHTRVISCMGMGLRRFLPSLWAGLLAWLAIMGGMILLVIPGIVIMCMMFVVTPVAVIERLPARAAMQRSRELTKGCRRSIFWLYLLFAVMTFAVFTVIVGIADPESAKKAHDHVAELYANRTLIWGNLASDVVLGSLLAALQAVAYVVLRDDKDGVGAEQLAKVFE